ncbi:MAG: hypothetical protein SFX73_34680 [Kofleriaceae bacterium]|nr:hypothetical protein [Kofleriaceae bacterium]
MLIAITLATSACYVPHYTKRRIAASEVAHLHRSGRDAEIILRADDGEPVRLGPRSYVRFQRADGSYTGGFEARDLAVSTTGVTNTGVRVPLNAVMQIRVANLDPPLLAILRRAAPGDASMVRLADGTYELYGSSAQLVDWVSAFVLASGRSNKHDFVGGYGDWRFLSVRGWGPAMEGYRISDVLEHGFLAPDGLRWDEIQAVEVAYVDGWSVGTSAIGLLTFVGGGLASGALSAGMAVGQNLASGAYTTSSPSAAPAKAQGAGTGTEVRGEEPPFGTRDPAVGFASTSATPPSDTRPMFGTWQRWRSVARPVLALESGGDVRHRDELGSNATLAVRALEALELGGGVRQLWRQHTSEAPRRTYGGFLHLGMVFDLDARRRISLPLAYQLGGVGRAGLYMRFGAGVRVRLVSSLTLGIHPLNPVYTGTSGRASSWSFPTTIEVGYTF